MLLHKFLHSIITFLITVMAFTGLINTRANANESAAPSDYTISGPYTHQNLDIFLFHGESQATHMQFITLQEAMQAKTVTVYETGNVQELAIENKGQHPIFIQAGDIVKGGKQDRVIRQDLVLEPNSGKVAIGSFCVEQGRWSPRGDESSQAFSSSDNYLASRELKLAATYKKSQSEVWQEVANTQNKLNANTGVEIKDQRSQSSLQLTMENETLQTKISDYETALKAIISRRTDTLGFVAVINGDIVSADIYANHQLFGKLWPKMLNAAATEALAAGQPAEPATTKTANDIDEWLADKEKTAAEAGERQLNTSRSTKDSEDALLVDTTYQDDDTDAINLRKSILMK